MAEKSVNSENVFYLEDEDIYEKNNTNYNIDDNKLGSEIDFYSYSYATLTREVNLLLIGFFMGIATMYLLVRIW